MKIRGSNRPETPDLDDLAVAPFGYAVEPARRETAATQDIRLPRTMTRPTPRDNKPMGVHPIRRMTSPPATWSHPSMAAQQERVAA